MLSLAKSASIYVHPDATVCDAVSVALIHIINTTARTEGRRDRGRYIIFLRLSQIEMFDGTIISLGMLIHQMIRSSGDLESDRERSSNV